MVELDGARHREILADERFHRILVVVDYVTVDDDNLTVEDKI